MFRLQCEAEEERWEVEALFDSAFGPGRIALSAYRLREGVPPVAELSLTARDEFRTLCGAIRFWPFLVDEEPALLLGPVAVHPTRQGEGLGGLLIRDGVDRARDLGWRDVFLIGDQPYYGRFGFSQVQGITFPPPTDPARILHFSPIGAECGLQGSAGKWSGGSGVQIQRRSDSL
ncbi:MAG: N-acetyltransferase [Rhodobacteraceae bacterium]|nr:N-acetyltransferase [Paracoccaceae bacterium]